MEAGGKVRVFSGRRGFMNFHNRVFQGHFLKVGGKFLGRHLEDSCGLYHLLGQELALLLGRCQFHKMCISFLFLSLFRCFL